MHRCTIILIAVAAAVALLASCMVAVDVTEHVIITQFGRPLYDGPISEPGFRWKAPYQSVWRFDRRVRLYDPPASEFLTRDRRNTTVDTFVVWKIADAMQFLKSVTDATGAEIRLGNVVLSAMRTEIGRSELSALVSHEPGQMKLGEIALRVAEQCRGRLAAEYGIELVDVQIKRLNFPQDNKQAVFDRMREERRRVARGLRAEGEESAQKIRAQAAKEATTILSEAYAKAETIRGDGDAEAARTYAKALQKDPEFYKFVRTLDAYKKFLNDKTTLILSSDSELLRLLTAGRKAVIGDQ